MECNLWFTGLAISPDEPLIPVNCIALYFMLVKLSWGSSNLLPGRYRLGLQCCVFSKPQWTKCVWKCSLNLPVFHTSSMPLLVSVSPKTCFILSREQTLLPVAWVGMAFTGGVQSQRSDLDIILLVLYFKVLKFLFISNI